MSMLMLEMVTKENPELISFSSKSENLWLMVWWQSVCTLTIKYTEVINWLLKNAITFFYKSKNCKSK